MKMFKFLISAVFLIAFGIFIFKYFDFFVQSSRLRVRDFNYATDAHVVDGLFHKGDNLYWLILGQTSESPAYNVFYMLQHASSSQFAPLHDLFLKVAVVDNQVVGFLAFHKISDRLWKLLFLIVDQDYRQKGVAKTLLKYAIHEMTSRGATQIKLLTRNNNFKAQSLYKGFGFKIVAQDDLGVWMTWNK